MFDRKATCLFLIYIFLNSIHSAEENVEVSCNINIKKAVQCVSEKFLSITVDPAVLLAGVNLSENSLRLAKRLSPAYIRIAGPSTQFVKYIDKDDKSGNFLSEDGNTVKITPAVWFGVNEWLKLAKLMPIFAVNDAETARGLWNPKTTLPLFELAEKLNVSCYWQLGYDSSDKNETRYKQDINIFHYILTAYGARNDTWKIIGSDVSSMPADRIESIMMEENDVLEAVMWEPSGRDLETFPEKDTAHKILLHQSAKPRTKMWTTVPKSSEPVTFGSALLWAKQVGNAAKMGYDVIFRQPRIYELFTDTPVYWFSVLHKSLIGCHVLETKSSIFQEETDIFAHCTKKQNSFVRRGAVTVMIINDRPSKYKVKVKLGNSLPEKSMEIQNYILTSDNKNSTDIYLNGKLLTPKVFQEKKLFQPKIRRTKTTSHILLSLPPSSIGFFVLPGARVPVCIDKEKEIQLLLEEIEENQNNGLSEEIALQLGSRASFSRNNLLEEITQKLKEEMKSDEKYYKKSSVKLESSVFSNHVSGGDKEESKVDEKGRKLFIDRIKHKKALDFQKKGENLKKFLLDKSKTPKTDQKPKNMDLTSEEMEKILKDRAIERAAKKNIVFTDEELEALIRKAGKNFNSPKNKRSIPQEPRKNRAINKHLLEKYSQKNQQSFDTKQNAHDLKMRSKRSVQNVKKRIRDTRGINFDLLDLKSRIAEHKKAWQDKKDDLLGNSNTIKENLKDKIRELKSKLRIKREISMDGFKKSTKKKSKKTNSVVINNDEIEATIRQSGQTSADILEELEHARATEDTDDEEDEEKNQGEIFAELADSEDLEDDLLLDTNPPKSKKLNIFEKKPKIDPFAVAHPTIDIVDSSKRRNKKKKSKSDDKLQFLTTSEEFEDIEDDLPSIHEYFGPKQITGKKKKSSNKEGELQEMNEYYDTPQLFKREIHKFSPEDKSRKKRGTGFAILEMAKFQDDLQPEDFLQDILFNPVLEMPLIDQFYNYEIKALEDEMQKKHNLDEVHPNDKVDNKANNSTENNSTSNSIKNYEDVLNEKPHTALEDVENDFENMDIPPTMDDSSKQKSLLDENISKDISEVNQKIDHISDNDDSAALHSNNLEDQSDISAKQVDIKNDIGSEKFSTDELQIKQPYDEIGDDNSEPVSLSKNSESENMEKLNDPIELTEIEQNEASEIVRRKRDITEFENSVDEEVMKKKTKKKQKKPVKKEKKPKKHDEKKLKTKPKQKNDNKHFADQMNLIKDKLQERKDEIDRMIKKQKEMEQDIKNQWKTKIAKKKKSPKTDKEVHPKVNSRSKVSKNQKSLKKRSIFNTKKVFGNYHPITADLKIWKPSDISSLRKEIHFAKKLSPPNDYPIFKNIFSSNKPYNLKRKRRFIDTDVDLAENGIDDHINEIDDHINEISKETSDTNFNNNFEEEIIQLNKENNKLKAIIQDYKDDKPNFKEEIEETYKDDDAPAESAYPSNILKIEDNGFAEKIYNTNNDSDNIEDKPNNTETFIKDGDYKFTLPNNDEFEINKTGDDTEIKFLHHDHEAVNNFNEEIDDLTKIGDETFIPKITPRAMKPFEEIEKFFGNVKKLFDKVGNEVKFYFNNMGLTI